MLCASIAIPDAIDACGAALQLWCRRRQPVLSLVDKNDSPVRHLRTVEFDAMLAAFGRAGATVEARRRGAGAARQAQQRECWFRCDCLEGMQEPSPILVPVLERFIRRSPHHADHADACPFEMGDVASADYAKGVREPKPDDIFRLAGKIDADGAALPGDDDSGETAGNARGLGARSGRSREVCKAYERSKLSQLLFKLLSDAQVRRVGRGPRGHANQWEAVYRAARGILLGDDLPLSDVLHTDPGQLDLLLGCISSRQRWPRERRPHGVLVFTAVRIEGEVIVAVSGTRLAVEGPPIAVFGPGRGDTRTGPFIVAVLVASPDGRRQPVPMKAFAQPCWSLRDILPLDSSKERVSLDILVRYQSWMGDQWYAVEITKPLDDRAKYYFGDKEPDQVVKPDFEGTIHAIAGRRFARSVVVETMGFDTSEYRVKKQRLKEILTRKPGHYLEHQAHDPAAQAVHDLRFRRDLFAFGTRVVEADKRRTA